MESPSLRKRNKKRCRRPTVHQFDLGYFDIDYSLDKLKELASIRLTKEMKTINRPYLKLCHITISDNIETWEPFSGRDKELPLELETLNQY